MFGAIFLALKCQDEGGVTVIEFKLDTSKLTFKDGGGGKAGTKYRSRVLKSQGILTQAQMDPNLPLELPTPEQITGVRNAKMQVSTTNANSAELWKAYDELQTIDVVTGSADLTPSQRAIQEDATVRNEDPDMPFPDMPPLQLSFNQVVLITDKATQALEWVGKTDLSDDLVAKQAILVDLQAKKAAKKKAEEEAAAAKKAQQAADSQPSTGSGPA
ncbi:hypothetical protein B0H19DRAFT_1255228 [Mycena capillaripes]|nr:hypothetical protein B0H19DRAFT_1255228 [Mycena capillaripes]